METPTGKLWIVPTPIGNLGDMTFRAVDVLRMVDSILAEDTRQTKKLLTYYEIATKLEPYHQFNEHKMVSSIIRRLQEGQQLALVSDAGTPGFSDPGFLLIRAALEENISLEVLPGAVAAIVALIGSGFPVSPFVFDGFLPHKKGKMTKIKSLETDPKTTIFYESPHRIVKTLEMVKEHLGGARHVVVARELTKKFEEYVRGTCEEVLHHFSQNEPRGEIVLIIKGYEK